ncbi:unnamed protein product [Clonostachys rosea]|uniref:Heterokaryon incompatibility domain-containing protein n=1 Tax=Bionectria ochroleuca TaxID=29856 RepID=A0ABY6USN5_BIOOC|nr:unnamed protein product [Clonostachys rosea]
MGRNQAYCCICGGPFLEPGTRENEPGAWLCYPVLWTTAHNTKDGADLDMYQHEISLRYTYDLVDRVDDSQRRVLEEKATYREHNLFLISESSKEVPAFHVFGDTYWDKSALYFALHNQCSKLVQRFISTRHESHDVFHISDKDEICSVKQLWEVLFARVPASGCNHASNIEHPTRYYGVARLHRTEWEPDDDLLIGELVEADPIEVPKLTESILDNLEPCVSSTQSDETSNNIIDQDWWFNKLIAKEDIPWIWDLDEDQVRKKQRTGAWDWELLIKKLSRPDIYRPEDETLRLPLGLRNRRRIWRCIEEARLGDI